MNAKLKRFFRRKFINTGKVFCVGCNKTGTTSLEAALKDFGYRMGSQPLAEKLTVEDWGQRDFRRIIRYCRTAEAFQDLPFSKPYTYQALDAAIPNSKFILTIRDSSEQWYSSITRFHAKLWGENGRIPTKRDLQKAPYNEVGMAWRINRLSFASPEDDPYRKEDLMEYYERHNANVIEYFRHRPNDLLVLNVADDGAYRKLCEFLEKPCLRETFPWENKT
jgi:hypothetical protein